MTTLLSTPSYRKYDGQDLDAKKKTNFIVPAGCLLLFILVFAVFGRTLGHGFSNYDDSDCTFGNPAIVKGITVEGVKWAFTHSVNANWLPVTTLSHMVDCQLYGINPHGHHFTNVLIHALTAALLFLTLNRLINAQWRSLFVAAVFAIHPLRAESVAWIAERKDLLSGLFFVLTLLGYTHYCRTPDKTRRRKLYALTLLAFAFGLMSKPMLVTVPVVLLIVDFWPLQRLQANNWKQLVAEKIPFAVLSAIVAGITLLTQKSAESSLELLNPVWRLANAAISYIIYIRQLFIPTGLSVFYVNRGPKTSLTLTAICALVLVILSIFAWRQRKDRPYFFAGWLWYLTMLIPVIGIVQVGSQAHADRYTYLPQIGLCIAVVWITAEFASRHALVLRSLPWLAAIVVLCLAIAGFGQVGNWRNTETLWSQVKLNTDSNAFAENALGSELALRGDVDGAIQHYQRAVSLNPNFADAQNNLGYLLMFKQDFAGAENHYQAALHSDPSNATVLRNLGNLHDSKGDSVGAMRYYERALQVRPDDAEAHYNLGNKHLGLGNFPEAIAHFRAALQNTPNHVMSHMNLANALSRQGNSAEATEHFQRALELNPEDSMVHYNFGVELSSHSNFTAAAQQFQQALDLGTKYKNAPVVEAARKQLNSMPPH